MSISTFLVFSPYRPLQSIYRVLLRYDLVFLTYDGFMRHNLILNQGRLYQLLLLKSEEKREAVKFYDTTTQDSVE